MEGLDASRHAAPLFEANAADADGRDWTYSTVGPFTDVDAFLTWARAAETSRDPMYYAIVEKTSGKPLGTATYMRITPENGVIEVGNIKYAPALQRTTAATEAMYLMMDHAFSLGYRRYEWKCDSHNAPSRRAAERLGFTFEGLFRQALIYKGRNRDTTWFSIIDSEWPVLKPAYQSWLAPENFDAQGRQCQSLSDLIGLARKQATRSI